jgi:hypothetical protein
VPSGGQWIHDIKFDGYRVSAAVLAVFPPNYGSIRFRADCFINFSIVSKIDHPRNDSKSHDGTITGPASVTESSCSAPA